MSIRVLGIDPGLSGTGIGILEGNPARVSGYAFGAIETEARATEPDRLNAIYIKLSHFLQEKKPDMMIIEDIYSLEAFPRSGIMLGKVSGVLQLAAFQAGVPVKEIAVREAKKIICGNGKADKHQMERAVRHLLKHPEPIRPFHASDALALALTGFYRYKRG